MVLRKKEVYTVITPIPSFIPRQLAIDILHSHGEVITLNPLVLRFQPTKAPRDAPSDEYYSTWYEITERIQFIPGIGKLGSGVINFNGCFHDLPWGLQTHIYAPAGVDLRNKYRIGGNQPGVEPPEQQEIGLAKLGAPKDGLYLREDIEIRCNFAMVGFVKDQLKAASREMVDRIIKKAELLDAGILTAMIEDGKIRTQNPHDRSSFTGGLPGASMSPPRSPTSIVQHNRRESTPASPSVPYQVPRPLSYQQQQYNRPTSSMSNQPCYAPSKSPPSSEFAELPGQPAPGAPLARPQAQLQPPQQAPPPMVMELPGDMYHPQQSPSLQPSSTHAKTEQWCQSQNSPPQQNSRPVSYSSDNGSYTSQGHDYGKYASDLATHRELPEEYNAPSSQPPAIPPKVSYAAYNPADYAPISR
jgi:hypothetical protein